MVALKPASLGVSTSDIELAECLERAYRLALLLHDGVVASDAMGNADEPDAQKFAARVLSAELVTLLDGARAAQVLEAARVAAHDRQGSPPRCFLAGQNGP